MMFPPNDLYRHLVDAFEQTAPLFVKPPKRPGRFSSRSALPLS
jgi:hypothetical protein